MQQGNLRATLRSLHESGCEFIVVGGLAAVLHGAPIQTYDIDLVYRRTAENIDHLLTVLASLDAVFRVQPQRRLRPTAQHLLASGHLNLLTVNGPLDLLATAGRNLSYEDLITHSVEMDIGDGIRIRVLDLETLIALKQELAGEKDIAVLPILRQTLREIKKKRDSGWVND